MSEQAQNTLHENSIGYAILLVVFAAIAWIFWVYFDVETRNVIRWIRYGQTYLMSFVLPQDFTVIVNGVEANWHQGFRDIPKWQAEELSYNHLAYFIALALQPLKYVLAAICLIGAIWVQMRGPKTNDRRSYTIESLIKRQRNNFPVISPFATFDPSTQPPRAPGSPVPAELPLFAEALGPEEWLAYNEIPAPDGKIDEKVALNCFKRQLVGRWKGVKGLKPHQQILLAAFCLKASRKRRECDELLARIAQCWSFKGGLDLKRDRKLLSEAQKVLRNKKLAANVLTKCNRHAFVTTAMLRALQTAREEGGVLAPAEFVWLRAYDRTLWYPLNNLGRQSFHMESIGAMSHFRAEKMTQRPIPVPKISDALDTITSYMSSAQARAIPPLDYTHSKKRGVKKAK